MMPLHWQYRCSNGHWVSSTLMADLEDATCNAQFGSPTSTAPLTCGGTLGEAMIARWEIDHLLGGYE